MRNILITGGNTGIGFATVLQLVDADTKIFFTSRNEETAAQAVHNIKTTRPDANVEYLILDLSDLQSVKDCAAKFIGLGIPLHVLILNAGVVVLGQQTKQGHELMFGVNHLGHFLFTLLLLPVLRNSAPSRIVVVTSDAHKFAPKPVEIEEIPTNKSYTLFNGYSLSKLCNIWFTHELSRQLEGSKVTVNCVHPGVVNTNLFRNMPFLFKPFLWLIMAIFYTTVEQAGRNIVFLAKDESVENVSGKYFVNCLEAATSEQAQDPNAEKQLWEFSEKLVQEYLEHE